MKILKIDQTDIFLEDYEKLGQGKITISDPWIGAFTYSWGSMGSQISEFIKSINEDYFAGKLCNESRVFDGKQSTKAIRKYIREEMKYELPFYKFQELQKEMREKINELEECETENEFVNSCERLPDSIYGLDVGYEEEKEFKKIIDPVFKCEPWNFISNKPSQEYLWLTKIHKKLKKIL